MAWEVEGTNEFSEWYWSLDEADQERLDAVIDMLTEHGPALRRPFVGNVQGSEFRNMKELIPVGSNIRAPLAFDPRRTAILLIAGDKTNRWREFYEVMVPEADRLYREHLREIEGER